MNTKHIIAAAAFSLIGIAAHAQEGVQWPEASAFNAAPSTTSRAAVQAEVKQAIANHTLFVANEGYSVPDTSGVSQRSREEVRAEAREAVRSHRFGDNNFDYRG